MIFIIYHNKYIMNINNYGYSFNLLEIENNILIKKAKNIEGSNKIKNEINFYKFIIDNNINFPIPEIYNLDNSNNIIKMKYLKDYKDLTNIFNENYELIQNIILNLNSLHKYTKIITKQEYLTNLKLEIYDKIVYRYNKTDWNNLNNFKSIKTINNVEVKNLSYYLNIINNKILNIINNNDKYEFCLIHGDTHLGNILINNKDLRFIDPRGYFGNSKLYGIKEYDYAKLLFGISGYSIFDQMDVKKLDISNNNIQITFIEQYCKIYEYDIFNKYTKLLSLTIWLGNNSSFINNEKKITSLMIALYLCEKYLSML